MVPRVGTAIEEVVAPPNSRPEVIRVVSAYVAPGSYRIHVGWPDIGKGNCGADESITILKDHPRRLTLLGHKGIVLTSSTNSIAGLLPFPGLHISLRYASDDYLVPGSVEGDAYYFDGVPPGHAYLRIFGPRYRWVEFDLGTIGVMLDKKGVVFNVTRDMLASAAPAQ
ncbi:MAG: hypothetical protein ABI182_08170 [Candidatus Baltobacteraceae bacterium]